MYIPSDKFILLSMLNMKLRDMYSSLEDLCEVEECDLDDVKEKMLSIGYAYSPLANAFKVIGENND